MRVCVVITSRASYARFRSALQAIHYTPDAELVLILAGAAILKQRGDLQGVCEADDLPVAETLQVLLEGGDAISMAKTTGLAMIEFASAFERLRPDCVVTIADRYETLATAVAASYLGIPLVHVQGGEVTGSIDDKVRNAVTQLADMHLVATKCAADRIGEMCRGLEISADGRVRGTIHITGCPSIDLAAHVAETAASGVFGLPGVGAEIDLAARYLMVLQHPVTTHEHHSKGQIHETLMSIHELRMPTLWFWPNVDAGSAEMAGMIRTARERQGWLPHVRFIKNLGPETFLRLAKGAACIVGNSSVAIRECSYLGTPAVNIGTRQAGRERAWNVVDVGYDREQITAAILRQLSVGRYACSKLYGEGIAGQRVAEILDARFGAGKNMAEALTQNRPGA